MKKMIKLTAIILALLMTLCACSSAGTEDHEKSSDEEASKASVPTAADTATQPGTSGDSAAMPTVADYIESTDADAPPAETDPVSPQETEAASDPTMPTVADYIEPDIIDDSTLAMQDQAYTLEFNKQVTADGVVKFMLTDAFLTEDILPSDPSGSYNYIAGEDGCIYMVLMGTIENISGEEIDLATSQIANSPVATQFIVNETYAYEGSWVAEKPDGSSITSRLAAGEATNFYIFAAVEADMAAQLDSVTVLTGFSDLQTNLYVFGSGVNWDACTHQYVFEVPGVGSGK